MHNTFPTIPEFLCILLFLVFICALGYMGFNMSRNPTREVTMQTITDTQSIQTIQFEVCGKSNC